MAKGIVWERLTRIESETLADLVKNGKEVYAAPMEIECREQLDAFGLSWDDCKTWHIGSDKVIVHLTPADKATYDMLLGDLRKKHRDEYRQKRCKIPGKQKALIRCPECNSCANCPFPEYRDKHQPDVISWDGLLESGYEQAYDEDIRQLDVKSELESVCAAIDAENPKYTRAIVLKELYGYPVKEIAQMMDDTERNIYFYISEAKRIGKQYRENNQ